MLRLRLDLNFFISNILTTEKWWKIFLRPDGFQCLLKHKKREQRAHNVFQQQRGKNSIFELFRSGRKGKFGLRWICFRDQELHLWQQAACATSI